MGYVLFLIYLVLFCWLIIKSRFVINAGLSTKIIILLFLLKVIAGCLNSWIFIKMGITSNADTMVFHNEGLIEYHLLFSDPKEYIRNFFHSNYKTGYGEFFSSTNSYWNDLTSNLVIKLLSIFDIFSFGNFYVNVIFYNYITFFGAIGLYRVFNVVYANKSYLIICTCFLLPSLLFYSSNIHKEGLIYAAIGTAVFNMYKALNKTGFTPAGVVYISVALIFIFLQRNYVLMALLPALLAWILTSVKKYPPLVTFVIIYAIGTFIFFNIASVSSKLNLPASISKKQWDFKHLPTASTYIALDSLAPTFKSFALNAPQAINHSLLRPYLKDIKLSKALLPQAIELFFYELLLLIFIFFKNKTGKPDTFILFSLFFSLSVLLIIGYTIPIIGAIVRYRSIYLPFLITPIVCNTNWGKIKVALQIKK